MAGVTDRPFRRLCQRLGAALAVSEMLTADTRLWDSGKSRRRLPHAGEPTPVAVQIAGADPGMLAEAAAAAVAHGAEIVDINMGCPAKKVCRRLAGSALLEDESLVERILNRVVAAVPVPVTLKIRTGPSPERRNGVRIARIAEDAGVRMLSVHGRTRSDRFHGQAEYSTIAAIKRAVSLPVIANGDVDSPQKARTVLEQTGADGLMIGRAAQGNPWIFREIDHYLTHGKPLARPSPAEVARVMRAHLRALHRFYGEPRGVRVARKHIGWYLAGRPNGEAARRELMRVDCAAAQLELIAHYFAGPESLAA